MYFRDNRFVIQIQSTEYEEQIINTMEEHMIEVKDL